MYKDVLFIGAASGWGAPDSGCGDGPEALVDKGLLPCFWHLGHQICPPITTLYPLDGEHHSRLAVVTDMAEQISAEVEKAILDNFFPVVLGGDHSCAIGTWAGVHRATRNQGDVGLIWVDAHMDSHTPNTSHSGQLHGMPLACLMGYGDDYLTRLGNNHQSVKPQNVCLLGVRSYEPEEKQLLDRLGVRVFTMEEINTIGFAAAWEEAQNVVCQNTIGFGVSIDLDALDPREAPGVGSPEQGGIHTQDIIEALYSIQDSPRVLTLEVTEYNPHRDRNNATAAVMAELISAVIG